MTSSNSAPASPKNRRRSGNPSVAAAAKRELEQAKRAPRPLPRDTAVASARPTRAAAAPDHPVRAVTTRKGEKTKPVLPSRSPLTAALLLPWISALGMLAMLLVFTEGFNASGRDASDLGLGVSILPFVLGGEYLALLPFLLPPLLTRTWSSRRTTMRTSSVIVLLLPGSVMAWLLGTAAFDTTIPLTFRIAAAGITGLVIAAHARPLALAARIPLEHDGEPDLKPTRLLRRVTLGAAAVTLVGAVSSLVVHGIG